MKIKFFVSSTFRDMDTERDLLRSIVTSRLNHLYERKGLMFEFVDLRYSLTTDVSLTAEEREQQIFDYCMEEIERCAPYFIGLIGHRYGWVPRHKTDVQMAEIQNIWDDGLPLRIDEMSVTALEFLHGAIGRRTDDRAGKLIYVRSEKSYENTSKEELADFIDANAVSGSNRIMREYVKSLDGQRGIRTTEYTMRPTYPTVKEMEQWCDMVVADIGAIIDAKFANQVDLDPFHAANERYIAEHIRNFKGRNDLLDDIRYLNDSQIYISGECDSGRTSLLCKGYDLMKNEENIIPLFASSYATPRDFKVLTLASKWAGQLSVASGIELPEVLEHAPDYDLLSVCDAYYDFHQEVVATKECTVVHFVEGTSGDLNELLSKGVNLVLLQDRYSSNMQYSCIDTTELDDDSLEEIVSQLRPVLKNRLLEHPSSYNIGWLSLAVHILENLTRSCQQEMRKSQGDLSGEEGISAYLCDMVTRFPDDTNELRGFWIGQLAEIFGAEFVRDYMCVIKLSPYGVTDEYVAHVTGAPQMWCVSFRQTAGNNVIKLNELNLWTSKSRETAFNVLKGITADHLKGMAERAEKYLESLSEEYPERCNLFTIKLHLRDYPALREYFGQKEFYTSGEYRAERNYAWIRFVIEQSFDAQEVVRGIMDVLPLDADVWRDFIACQNSSSVPQAMRFLFMRLIEMKINEILVSDPESDLRKSMKDVYRASVNSAPDSAARRLELRKYLQFYSDLFRRDVSWREEYLSAVTFHTSFMPRDTVQDFLLHHLGELSNRSALTYEEGEPTREFAKLYFMIGTSLSDQRNFTQSLHAAASASELFHNSFIYLLMEDLPLTDTVQALNCYHTVTLQLILLYERFNHTRNSTMILERISGFVETVDAIMEKFDGLGPYGDDSVADECRGIYLYARIFLIGADESRTPEERIRALEEEHQICLNLAHNDCHPRANDMTMPNCGMMAMMMLMPTAPLWMTLGQVMICFEAAWLIYRYRLDEHRRGQFWSFSGIIGLTVSQMWQKSILPGGAPILKSIFDYLKVLTGALVEANREAFPEEEMAENYEKLLRMIQNLDPLPAESEIAGELLNLAVYSIDNSGIYEEMLEENRLEDIIRSCEELDGKGFFDLYYIGLAYLRLDKADEAKSFFSMLMSRRRILNKSQEFSVMCNYLAACLRDMDFDEFEYWYDNRLSEADREDSDVMELRTLYDAFRSGEIDADQMKESIQGFIL